MHRTYHSQQYGSQGSARSDHRWDPPAGSSQGYTSYNTQTPEDNALVSPQSPSSLGSLEEWDNPSSQVSDMSGYRTPDVPSHVVSFPSLPVTEVSVRVTDLATGEEMVSSQLSFPTARNISEVSVYPPHRTTHVHQPEQVLHGLVGLQQSTTGLRRAPHVRLGTRRR